MGEPDDGEGLIVGVGAALNEGAGIGIAPDHDAGDGRSDSGVILKRLHTLVFGARGFGVLLSRGHGGFGGVDLRLRTEVLGLRIVEFLLRDQARTRGCRLLQTLRLGVERGVERLGALDLLLRARDLFLALLELESGLLELRFQLRNFEDRQRFALMHDVADVDVDVASCSRSLWDARRLPDRAGTGRQA